MQIFAFYSTRQEKREFIVRHSSERSGKTWKGNKTKVKVGLRTVSQHKKLNMRKGESRLEYENHIKTNEKVKCVRKCKGVL